MKALRNVFAVIITIAVALYLIFAPEFIMSGIENSRNASNSKQESFTGIINLWHIVGFKAHTGSVTNFLYARASEFEKSHFGVFISVTSMTEEEYKENISAGKRADIYSFPLGLEYSDAFMPLDSDALSESISSIRSGFIETGKSENTLYALPYLYSGCCLITNDDLLTKQSITMQETPDKGSVNDTLNNLSTDAHTPLCGDEIYSCLYGLSSASLGEYDSFKSGRSEFAVSDFRAYGDIERRQGSKGSFSASAYTIFEYTDLVQYIALDKSISDKKQGYAYEFMEKLFTEHAQAALSDLNAYPVIEADNIAELKNKYTSIAYDAFSVYRKPKIPNCFLYKRYRDALKEDALKAVSGDADAKLRFDKRIAELIG